MVDSSVALERFMEIHEKSLENATFVSTRGPLDSSTSPQLEKSLERLLESSSTSIVLDLAGTDYVSSAGLRVILSTVKSLQGGERRFLLCGVNESVKNVLAVTGFDRVITIAADADQARGTVEKLQALAKRR